MHQFRFLVITTFVAVLVGCGGGEETTSPVAGNGTEKGEPSVPAISKSANEDSKTAAHSTSTVTSPSSTSNGLSAANSFDSLRKPAEQSKSLSAKEEPETTLQPARILKGHTEEIRTLAVSPDGKVVASAGNDKSIRLWNVETGKSVAELNGHANIINSLAFSPDGKLLISGGGADNETGQFLVWNVAEKAAKPIHRFEFEDTVNGVAFSPKGDIAVALPMDSCVIYDTSTWEVVHELQDDETKYYQDWNFVTFRQDGAEMAVARGPLIQTFDVSNWKLTNSFRGTDNQAGSVQYFPKGDELALPAAFGGLSWIWKTSPSLSHHSLGNFGCNDADFSGNPDLIAATHEGTTIVLLDRKTYEPKTVFRPRKEGNELGVRLARFADKGKSLVVTAYEDEIHVWDVSMLLKQESSAIPSPANEVTDLAQIGYLDDDFMVTSGDTCTPVVSPDGKILYTHVEGVGVELFDVESGKRIETWGGPTVDADRMALSADGNTLVVADDNSAIHVWNTASKQLRYTYRQHPEDEDIEALAVSADGSIVVTSDFSMTEFVAWNSANGAEKWRKPTKWRDVKPIAFSPDGRLVAIGNDRRIELCNANDGRETARIDIGDAMVSEIEFSPDGTFLIVGGELELDDFVTRRAGLAVFSTDTLEQIWFADTAARSLDSLGCSPDGTFLVVGLQQTPPFYGTLFRLYAMDDGHAITEINNAGGPFALSKDGSRLFQGSYNYVNCWDLNLLRDQENLSTLGKLKQIGVSIEIRTDCGC